MSIIETMSIIDKYYRQYYKYNIFITFTLLFVGKRINKETESFIKI